MSDIPTYGQPPWQQPGWQQGPWQPAGSRTPGTVQAAAIVTYICCGISLLMTLFFLLAAAFVGGIIADDFAAGDVAEVSLWIFGFAALSIVLSVVACWLAWQTTRRKSWARIALAVCSGIALALSLAMVGPHTLVVLPGTVAVLVLLFVPPSNDWFRAAA